MLCCAVLCRWVTQSVAELEVHSRIFDEMGFLPATPYNKINIHVGGTYGDKDAALQRFSEVGAACCCAA
jgi:UV DNA damage endonuclease